MNEIEVFDLKRMFVGDGSSWFVLEVAFRTTFMYLFTVVLVRLLGKRGMGQLAPFELVIIIALGSAVGDPMFYPEVPLIHAMVVVTVIVALQRGMVRLTDISDRVERLMESDARCLVQDGVIQTDALADERFSRDELFVALREEGVEHLGQVRRAFLEPSGRVSIWMQPAPDVQPGLRLLPASDPQCPVPVLAPEPSPGGPLGCVLCGLRCDPPPATPPPATCTNCGGREGWVPLSFVHVGEAGGQPDVSRRRHSLGT